MKQPHLAEIPSCGAVHMSTAWPPAKFDISRSSVASPNEGPLAIFCIMYKMVSAAKIKPCFLKQANGIMRMERSLSNVSGLPVLIALLPGGYKYERVIAEF